ncbi:hypothetical protein PENTCL1PPCAC_10971, partial [Pristionchus entomophagus]
MTILLYVLVLAPLACGPGTGKVTDKPEFSFNYSSPLAWTYFVTDTPTLIVSGQSLNEQMAQSRVNMDIEFAVLKAVESYGYSTTGVDVRNAVKAENIQIDLKSTASLCVLNNFIPEDGAVTKKCTKADGTTIPHNHVSTITATSPIALAQSNWENIAIRVYSSLTANAGVKFNG